MFLDLFFEPWSELSRVIDGERLEKLEGELKRRGIESRRNGYSIHAPILLVRSEDLKRAEEIACAVGSAHDEFEG